MVDVVCWCAATENSIQILFKLYLNSVLFVYLIFWKMRFAVLDLIFIRLEYSDADERLSQTKYTKQTNKYKSEQKTRYHQTYRPPSTQSTKHTVYQAYSLHSHSSTQAQSTAHVNMSMQMCVWVCRERPSSGQLRYFYMDVTNG